LSEVRWPGVGEFNTEEGHKIWYIGDEKHKEKGVAFMVHKAMTGSVIACEPRSSRMISIRLAATPKNITIIQVYGPTCTHTDEDIEEFYQNLDSLINTTPKKDILVA